jgi:enoyl-CoA hydratase/carnithine racemase
MSDHDDSSLVLVEKADGVATVTLNRPQARNALNDVLRAELTAAIAEIAADPQLRAVVLTGAGSAYCAGGDIADMRQRLAAPPGAVGAAGWRRQRITHKIVAAIHELDKVTIAAVNGPAAGLGADLAFCCDFVLASEQARFAVNYLRRGLIPDGGAMYFLPRRVGLSRAKELIYSGRTVLASEALALGLADEVVDGGRLLQRARELAAEFTGTSGIALGLAKSILDRSFELSLEDVYALGAQAMGICYATDEHRAAVSEFLRRD